MNLVYVAGPLRGNIFKKWNNIRKARKFVKKFWLANIAVYSPHMNSGWIDNPKTDKFVLPANIFILSKCNYLFVLDGWTKSQGTIKEIEFAKKNGIITYYESDYNDSGFDLIVSDIKEKKVDR